MSLANMIYNYLVLISTLLIFSWIFVVAMQFGIYSKEYFLYGIPAIILTIHTIFVRVTALDIKKAKVSGSQKTGGEKNEESL